jgi:hypothetical protein
MANHTLFELGRMGNRWICQRSMTLMMGVSVTGGDDHVWLGDQDVLEGGGGWSAPDAQRRRYTGADEEEEDEDKVCPHSNFFSSSQLWFVRSLLAKLRPSITVLIS